MSTYVVAYVADGEPKTYLIGGEKLFAPGGQPLFFVFTPAHAASLGLPVMMASVTAHMPDADWKEFAGSDEEEKAVLAKFGQVMAADNQRRARKSSAGQQ